VVSKERTAVASQARPNTGAAPERHALSSETMRVSSAAPWRSGHRPAAANVRAAKTRPRAATQIL
jgi:hypothetical protein